MRSPTPDAPFCRRPLAAVRLGRSASRLVGPLVLVAVWEGVSRSGAVNPHVFPPVSEIVARWAALLTSGRLLTPLAETLARALAGIALAVAAGLPLGLAMGRSRLAAWLFDPLFAFGFPLPKVALIPLYVHWFGLFSLSKILLVFTDCLFPIVLFTYHAARGVSPVYLWSAQARGTGRVRLLWRVVLPLALAGAYDGLQVALVVALLVAVVSEMVSGGGGLGLMMIAAYRYGDVRGAFAALATVSVVGYALARAGTLLRGRLLHWHTGEV